MSETTEHPADPTPERDPAPAPGTGPSGVPDTPAPDTDDTDEQKPQREAEEARAKEDRRIAQLRARLGAAEREQARQAAELQFYREQAQRAPQAEETPEQRYHRERAQIRTEVEQQIRTERFHEQGGAAYGDWKQRCDDLVKMGADAGMAALLVEMPDGHKVTAALANDPDEVERIANLRTERARAVALGKYAATIEADGASGGNGHARAAAPAVSRAPAPIRPVQGRAAPTFNEYTADGQALVDRYMRQDMDKRLRR